VSGAIGSEEAAVGVGWGQRCAPRLEAVENIPVLLERPPGRWEARGNRLLGPLSLTSSPRGSLSTSGITPTPAAPESQPSAELSERRRREKAAEILQLLQRSVPHPLTRTWFQGER
jgi:hypothetical protein